MRRKNDKETYLLNLRIVAEKTISTYVNCGETLTISRKAFDFDKAVKDNFKRFDGALRQLAEL